MLWQPEVWTMPHRRHLRRAARNHRLLVLAALAVLSCEQVVYGEIEPSLSSGGPASGDAPEAHASGARPSDVVRDQFVRITRDSCNGEIYRPRRDGVPVLREPDRTAEVVFSLVLGDRVCKVGERGEFAILSSATGPVPREVAPGSETPKASVTYARLRELYQVESRSRRGIGERIGAWLRYVLSGGVPDIPVAVPGTTRSPEAVHPATESSVTATPGQDRGVSANGDQPQVPQR
jgi:hypothetical protein